MFERKHSQDKNKDAAPAAEPVVRDPQAPKGRPTPTRREREDARKRPLVQPNAPRPAAGRTGREQRAYARQQMLSGNEKYLPERDKGPERALLRDCVDSRWNVGEFFLPILVVVMLMTLIRAPWAELAVIALVYGLMFLLVVDSFLSWRRAKKLVRARFGHDPGRGSAPYVIMRGMQIRRMRMPLPKVKRGTKIS